MHVSMMCVHGMKPKEGNDGNHMHAYLGSIVRLREHLIIN